MKVHVVIALVALTVVSCAGGERRPARAGIPTPAATRSRNVTSAIASTGLIKSIASNFAVTAELVPSWGTGEIPVSAAPDVVGAFRFTCAAGQVSADDPIVWPRQPGKSHLHQFFGNTLADANSTYASLRNKGDSTCLSKLNRSSYWQPAMLDGKGGVVRPDSFGIYYKRYPTSSPLCRLQGDECVPLPPGLKFTFGYDMLTGKRPTGATSWQCATQQGDIVTNPHSRTMTEALQRCAIGMRLEVRIEAPDCWNGTDTDSPNHRDHVAYAKYNDRGQLVCDGAHRKVMPQFTLAAFWTVTADASSWTLSSDAMMRSEPGGTFHADFFSAWDPATETAWTVNCIDKLLNCSGGDLGNGWQLRGSR